MKPDRTTCRVEEYKLREDGTPYSVGSQWKGFVFNYRFDVPKSTSGKRAFQPTKIVHVENYYWNSLKLLGIVGGTLGLTIGFSFNQGITWIIGAVTTIWRTVEKSEKIVPIPN